MYRINLLKPGSATRIAVRHHPHLRVRIDENRIAIDWGRVRLAIGAAVGANLICLAAIAPLQAEYAALRQEQDALTAQIQELRPRVDEARKLQSEIDALVASLSLISEMSATTSNWSGILDELQRLLPYDAWLVRIASRATVTQEKAEGASDSDTRKMRYESVDVEGVAVNYLSFSEFLMRLRQSDRLFDAVEIIGSTEEYDGVHFHIRLHLPPREVRF